jgi:putative transposase
MPRHARLDAPGVLHHIMIRGIEKGLIFRDDGDRNRFVERMGTICADTRTPCYAWALLGNHAHLLLKTGAAPLHTVMARLLTGYAVTFNKKYNRHGQLFQNRYKSILCQEDAYLIELVCYIHLNPIRAGLVKDVPGLSRYPYSGHAPLVGKASYSWQDVDYVLPYFGPSLKTARERYVASMEERLLVGQRHDLTGGGLLRSYGSWAEVRNTAERIKGDQRVLGDSAFVEKVLANEHIARRSSAKMAGLTLDTIANRVCDLYDMPFDSLGNGSRRARTVEARSLFCFWAVRLGGHPAAQVAAFLNMTAPAVGYAVERGEKVAHEKDYSL